MKILEISRRSAELINRLCQVWTACVQDSHHFLSEQDFQSIAAYVPRALSQVPVLVVAFDAQNSPVGFMGIDGHKLEMLFLLPQVQGSGLGRRLLRHGMDRHGVTALCVNEQNPQARGFYEHMGFQVRRRTETDEQGNPYPLLHMALPRDSGC